MATAMPPMPMPNGSAGAPPSGGPPGINGLMGAQPQDPSQPSPTAQERAKDQVRKAMTQIEQLADMAKALSRQFPDFAEAAKAIADAAKAGQAKIVGSMLQGLEGPPPPTAGV